MNNENNQSPEQAIIKNPGTIINGVEGSTYRISLTQPFGIDEASDEFVEKTGYIRKELREFGMKDGLFLVVPEDKERVANFLSELAKEPQAKAITYSIKKKDGSTESLTDALVSLRLNDGKMYAFGLSFDSVPVTEETKKLRVSEKELSLIIEQNGLMVSRYEANGQKMRFPQKIQTMFDLPNILENAPQELVKRGYVAQESISDWMKFFDKIDNGEVSGQAQIRFGIPDKEPKFYRMIFTPLSTSKDRFALISLEDINNESMERITNEIDRYAFIRAIETVYPLTIMANLTKNSYYMISYGRESNHTAPKSGNFDDLIKFGLTTIDPDYREIFANTFSRDKILESFKNGKEKINLVVRQLDDEGNYHWESTTVLRVENPYSDDILEITVARRCDQEKETEDKLKETLIETTGELSRKMEFINLIDSLAPITVEIYYVASKKAAFITGKLLESWGIFPKTELVLQTLLDHNLIEKKEMERAYQEVYKAIDEKRENFEVEFLAKSPDGKPVWLIENATRFVDKEGRVGYIAIFIDNTERKNLIDQLRMNKEETQIVLGFLKSSFVRYSVKEHLIYLPDDVRSIIGIERNEVTPESILSGLNLIVNDEKNRNKYQDIFNAIDHGNDTGKAELSVRYLDGTLHFVTLVFKTIFDDSKKPDRAIISLVDTSEYHREMIETSENKRNESIMKFVAEHSERIVYYFDPLTKKATALDPNQAKGYGLMDIVVDPFKMIVDSRMVFVDSVDQIVSFNRAMQSGIQNSGETKLHIRTLDDKERWFDVRFSSIKSSINSAPGIVLSFLDITDEHERELIFERYKENTDSLKRKSVVFFEADLTDDIIEDEGGSFKDMPVFIGKSYTLSMFPLIGGFIPDEVKDEIIVSLSKERLIENFRDGINEFKKEWEQPKNSTYGWVNLYAELVSDPFSKHIKAFFFINDITEEKEASIKIQNAAERDLMTGLYNKMTAIKMINQYLEHSGSSRCALLVLDLDDLKKLNDSLGHNEGDSALIYLAKTLFDHFRKTDIVARIGGDEFMVFLKNVTSQSSIKSSVSILERKIASREIGSDKLLIHASIGGVFGTEANENFDKLFQMADIALYHVKRRGKNDYAFYEAAMENESYEFVGHQDFLIRNFDDISHPELVRLMSAIQTYYPLTVSYDLTRNSYYVMNSNDKIDATVPSSGKIEDFVSIIKAMVHPDDSKKVENILSRDENLLSYENNQKARNEIIRLTFNKKEYTGIKIVSIYYRNENGDVCSFLFFRGLDEVSEKKNVL